MKHRILEWSGFISFLLSIGCVTRFARASPRSSLSQTALRQLHKRLLNRSVKENPQNYRIQELLCEARPSLGRVHVDRELPLRVGDQDGDREGGHR